ncbi:MAG: peptide ABC transporter [Chloroflexi bacterium HGW-Chloroflexi-10]|nr:MAG: peptide ABC transporter [Chloroflexi bacterium HGW-Chloroflexi-10]
MTTVQLNPPQKNININEPMEDNKPISIWEDSWKRLLKNKFALVSLILVAVMLFFALLGPYLTPYDYLAQNVELRNAPPSAENWLGTDYLGRDVLSRVIFGARTATLVSLLVVSLSSAIGMLVGSISGYLGGKIDFFLMWFTDLVMAFPYLILGVVISVSLRPPLTYWMESRYLETLNPIFRQSSLIDVLIVVVVITSVSWPPYARLLRSQVMAIRNRNYVLAARALGLPSRQIVLKYIIPNAIGPVIVAMSAGMGSAMLTESAFSFLGIGIRPPVPSWGNMINDGLLVWRTSPHLLAAPAVVLGLMTIAFSFLGDGLNDALNPRQWKG